MQTTDMQIKVNYRNRQGNKSGDVRIEVTAPTMRDAIAKMRSAMGERFVAEKAQYENPTTGARQAKAAERMQALHRDVQNLERMLKEVAVTQWLGAAHRGPFRIEVLEEASSNQIAEVLDQGGVTNNYLVFLLTAPIKKVCASLLGAQNRGQHDARTVATLMSFVRQYRSEDIAAGVSDEQIVEAIATLTVPRVRSIQRDTGSAAFLAELLRADDPEQINAGVIVCSQIGRSFGLLPKSPRRRATRRSEPRLPLTPEQMRAAFLGQGHLPENTRVASSDGSVGAQVTFVVA